MVYYSVKVYLIFRFLQVFPERHGKWKATTQSQEFLKSIKRYYSNTYTDGEKQDAINLWGYEAQFPFLYMIVKGI